MNPDIVNQVMDGRARFLAFYGHTPEMVFIGHNQASEIDTLIADVRKLGLVDSATALPRATICGMKVFRVDADSHLSFGMEQPSPCG